MSTPRDLLTHPCWQPEELGAPMPDLPHANSVCLPTWRDVVDYEEKAPRVMERLRAGYPRFVVPPTCVRLFEQARVDVCATGEQCHLYRSRRAAQRCVAHIARWSGVEARVQDWKDVVAVCFPADAAPWALKYWRHTGDGLSSRHAQALLEGVAEPDAARAAETIRARIAQFAEVRPEDVLLFSCGMSAIYTIYRCMLKLYPGRRVVQFGFPYVDTLKVVQDFGAPHLFLPHADAADLARLDQEAVREPLAGLLCEFPSNPVLNSTDLGNLHAIARRHRFPIVIDDTISTWTNVDLRPAADVIVTSLTKWFTGRGDVMLGAAVVNPQSPFASAFRSALAEEFEADAWGESLILAEALSRDAELRVRRANETALHVASWLRHHPAVEAVYYPAFQHRERYDRFRRPTGGYGGLFSFLLREPERTSEPFYNALKMCKGPNLGTVFSLCCPFTLLAHYEELDWAETCGVSRWLLRMSIGQEAAEDLIARLDHALIAARNDCR